MSERVVLQVIDDGIRTHTKINCNEIGVFLTIGAVIEVLHYDQISKGRSAEDSMRYIRKMLDDVENHAFELAQDRYRKE